MSLEKIRSQKETKLSFEWFDRTDIENYQHDLFLQKILCHYSKELKQLTDKEKEQLFYWIKLLKEVYWNDFVKAIFLWKSIKDGDNLYVSEKKIPLKSLVSIMKKIWELQKELTLNIYKNYLWTVNSFHQIEQGANIADIANDLQLL